MPTSWRAISWGKVVALLVLVGIAIVAYGSGIRLANVDLWLLAFLCLAVLLV